MPRARTSLIGILLAVVLAVPAAGAAGQEGVSVTRHVVTSFDGAAIEANLFLPSSASESNPVPLVLRTHGWGGTGETGVGGLLARLLGEGYAVLTWDQRGFGCSDGLVRINDPDTEGRDVSALIDWTLANAPIATDATGDPIIGMTGGSYAGGIQTATAAVDDRIDALAPEISWSDLRYALHAGQVVDQGWVLLLYSVGKATTGLQHLDPSTCLSGPHPGSGLDPAIDRGVSEFVTSGAVQPHTLDFLAKSSLHHYGSERPVTVPTLVINGSTDTLFDLTDGYGIYEQVRSQGVDARFIAFCGGHVACPDSYADAGDRAHLDDAIITWFAHHLKGQDVDTGAPVEYRTNEGVWREGADFPPTGIGRTEVTGSAEGLIVLPVLDLPDVEALAGLVQQEISGIPALPITSSTPSEEGDPRAATLEVLTANAGDVEVVGFPQVTLTVSGTVLPLEDALGPVTDALGPLPGVFEQVGDMLVNVPALHQISGIVQGVGAINELAGLGEPVVHVFVKLVHREAGEVLNLQEGAIRVDLSDNPVTVEVPMPGLAYTLPQGDHLDLQIATHSLMHATGRVPALLDVEVAAAIPTSAGVADTDASGGGEAEEDPAAGANLVTASEGPLPATGGSLAAAALLALLAAGLLRRR